MKILAFAATNNLNSINKGLVSYAAEKLQQAHFPNAEIQILDLNDYEMPLYRSDRESENGIPKQAQEFFRILGEADAILVSFAEYNGSYTAAFKNIFDWASRIDMKVYQDKAIVMMATSPGARGGAGVLQAATQSAPYFGAKLVGQFSLPSFYENFDVEKGLLTNTERGEELDKLLHHFAQALQSA